MQQLITHSVPRQAKPACFRGILPSASYIWQRSVEPATTSDQAKWCSQFHMLKLALASDTARLLFHGRKIFPLQPSVQSCQSCLQATLQSSLRQSTT